MLSLAIYLEPHMSLCVMGTPDLADRNLSSFNRFDLSQCAMTMPCISEAIYLLYLTYFFNLNIFYLSPSCVVKTEHERVTVTNLISL